MIREHTTIGARCVFGSYASSDGYTMIGDDVQVGQYAQLSQGARIGDGCFIGGHTVFSDNRMAVRDPNDDLFGASIGDFVRIGLACVILPGVTIGEESMVGAGSVVTHDVPPGVLAVGSPARVLRDLTDEEIATYKRSVNA
jgi:acetyltransferase-like isoleucine patch superfamily enzyme